MTQVAKVVVARRWGQSKIAREVQIEASVDEEQIRLAVTLDDFLRALAAEMGNPATLLTANQLLTRMRAALPEVVAEIKQASIHVSGHVKREP